MGDASGSHHVRRYVAVFWVFRKWFLLDWRDRSLIILVLNISLNDELCGVVWFLEFQTLSKDSISIIDFQVYMIPFSFCLLSFEIYVIELIWINIGLVSCVDCRKAHRRLAVGDMHRWRGYRRTFSALLSVVRSVGNVCVPRLWTRSSIVKNWLSHKSLCILFNRVLAWCDKLPSCVFIASPRYSLTADKYGFVPLLPPLSTLKF